MAARQQFDLPAGVDAKLKPWIESPREIGRLGQCPRNADAAREVRAKRRRCGWPAIPRRIFRWVTIEDIVLATGQKSEDNQIQVAAALEKLDAMVGLAPVKQEVKAAHGAARSRTEAPRAGPPHRCPQPAHGVHRPARRRQDRGRARDRRDFSGVEGAAQGADRGDRPGRPGGGICRANRDQDTRKMPRGARWHSVYRRGL